MLSNHLIIFLLLLGTLKVAKIQGKVFTVCEFVQELDDLHTIPRDQIYKHLCIIGDMIHTHKKRGNYLGLYSIGSEWWCGNEAPGGNCNVKCSNLLDDDITDDVACAQKIINSHGLHDGWGERFKYIFVDNFFCFLLGNSERECKRTHESKVTDCLESVDDFEDDAEWIFPNVTETYFTTTTFIPSTTLSPTSTSTESIAEVHKQINDENQSSIFSATNFFIAIAFISVIAIIVISIIRYNKVERFLRSTFTGNVQLV